MLMLRFNFNVNLSILYTYNFPNNKKVIFWFVPGFWGTVHCPGRPRLGVASAAAISETKNKVYQHLTKPMKHVYM